MPHQGTGPKYTRTIAFEGVKELVAIADGSAVVRLVDGKGTHTDSGTLFEPRKWIPDNVSRGYDFASGARVSPDHYVGITTQERTGALTP
jgi:hypothetical protein